MESLSECTSVRVCRRMDAIVTSCTASHATKSKWVLEERRGYQQDLIRPITSVIMIISCLSPRSLMINNGGQRHTSQKSPMLLIGARGATEGSWFDGCKDRGL